MVEITNTGVIDKIKAYLGLRGKAVVTSRNSLYPVVVVNSNEQSIPMRPPTIPVDILTNMIRQENAIAAGTTTVYTVPAGKIFYLVCYGGTDTSGTTNAFYGYIRNVGATALWAIGQNVTANGSFKYFFGVPYRLVAGDYIAITVAAGGSCTFDIYGWEEYA